MCVCDKFTLLSFNLLICTVLSVNKSRIHAGVNSTKTEIQICWWKQKQNETNGEKKKNWSRRMELRGRGVSPCTSSILGRDQAEMINACAHCGLAIFRDLFQLAARPAFSTRFAHSSLVITYLHLANRCTWTLADCYLHPQWYNAKWEINSIFFILSRCSSSTKPQTRAPYRLCSSNDN